MKLRLKSMKFNLKRMKVRTKRTELSNKRFNFEEKNNNAQAKMETHLGKNIRQLLREKNISAVAFAKMLGMNNAGVYKIFRKKHLSTALLGKISTALHADLLHLFLPDEEQKITSLKKEIDELKKENAFLREIFQAVKRK